MLQAATLPPGRPCPGARASRPHAVPLAAAELQCNAAASHPDGGNRIGQAEGEPWRRFRLIQVGEMVKAVPGIVRASRPRSREAIIVRAGRPRSREDTMHAQGHKIADAFWRPLSLKQVHLSSCLFVFIRVHWWFVFINDQNDRRFFLE